ncbi:hypothetical protein Poli38472_013645 [Pythium oligandrum]|uniref:Uncharacterized protein n=1 Tax=Pythium oligandrum TaxID=41045 RepID=A0A8K1CFE4_PYTOL|nr:hypothetical protein Poli38472_013645 [Pythium oligandrum]|eukprot:TMW61182.1 hypothetical protein Poli38472_013645 [Pythium oligandrum]
MRPPRSRRRRQMQRPRRAIPPRTLLNQVSEHLMAGNFTAAQAILNENPQLAMARQRRHNVFLTAFSDTDLPFVERMLERPRVRASFARRVRNASHRELFGVWQVTAIAVERGLADVVLQFHKLAPAKVTSGVFAAKGLLKERFNDVNPRVRALATQYEKIVGGIRCDS